MDLGKAIKLAIENVYKEELTDIFVRPYEVDLLKNDLFTKDIAKEAVAEPQKALKNKVTKQIMYKF